MIRYLFAALLVPAVAFAQPAPTAPRPTAPVATPADQIDALTHAMTELQTQLATTERDKEQLMARIATCPTLPPVAAAPAGTPAQPAK